MKWLGYTSKHNSWVAQELCNCDELIHDFEDSQLKKIFGATKANNGIAYAVFIRDHKELQLVQANDMLKKWPQPLIKFLEEKIEFEMPRRQVHFIDNIEVNVEKVVGKPTKILGCTDRDELKYWCEYTLVDRTVARKIVSGREANISFPEIIVSYLETKIDFNAAGNDFDFRRK